MEVNQIQGTVNGRCQGCHANARIEAQRRIARPKSSSGRRRNMAATLLAHFYSGDDAPRREAYHSWRRYDGGVTGFSWKYGKPTRNHRFVPTLNAVEHSGEPRVNPKKNPFCLRGDNAGVRMLDHAHTGE
ncbi:hypothetical protein [Cupriavidus sp. CP313]